MDLKLITVVKVMVQTILLILVVYFFGLDAWHRFEAKKAVMTSSEKEQDRVQAPAVTVCAFGGKNNVAFKHDHPGVDELSQEVIGHVCPGMKGDEIVKCIEEG